MGVSGDLELEAFYKVIAPYYDQDYEDILKGADIAFYRRMAETCGEPVLEMGCGTGRVLLPLARAGFSIHGMDSSVDMLAQLRRRLESEPADVRARVAVTHGDIRSTDLAPRFRLVIAPGNVMHSFLERCDQRAWLRNARRHLAPGGSLCFDVFQPDYRRLTAAPEWLPDTDRTDPQTGHRLKRFVRAVHELEWQRFRVDMRWVTEDADGRVLSEDSAAVMQRWFTRGELENLLELEGLQAADYWGGFEGEPFGTGAHNQVVRATAV